MSIDLKNNRMHQNVAWIIGLFITTYHLHAMLLGSYSSSSGFATPFEFLANISMMSILLFIYSSYQIFNGKKIMKKAFRLATAATVLTLYSSLMMTSFVVKGELKSTIIFVTVFIFLFAVKQVFIETFRTLKTL